MLKGSVYSLNILVLKHLRPSFVRIAVVSRSKTGTSYFEWTPLDITDQYCSNYLVLGYVKTLAEKRENAYLLDLWFQEIPFWSRIPPEPGVTVDQLPCTEMDCLYEFEPQIQLITVSDDSILRVFNSTKEKQTRSALQIRRGRTDWYKGDQC